MGRSSGHGGRSGHGGSGGRSEIKDGLRNKIEARALTRFRPAWRLAQRARFLRRLLNRLLINSAIYKIPTRPYAYSTMGSYTSWDSLTDRTFTGRHLPPVAQMPAALPAVDEVVKVLARPAGQTRVSAKSTMLFAHFAQWFTDGFLRTDRTNALRNTSTHEIDLCQLYGLSSATTTRLRSHQGGRMRCQTINGEDYPCFDFDPDEGTSAQFAGVPLHARGSRAGAETGVVCDECRAGERALRLRHVQHVVPARA